uniref:Viral histone-like protein n=1 Tax=Abalone asfa-like virus TaxID=2839893 RepID=A0A5K7XWX5_9VIRU|nr:histone-like protein A104R homolog protein [Abalone asfa-like virus]
MSVTKTQLIQNISDRLKCNKTLVSNFFDALAQEIKLGLSSVGEINIPNLVKITKKRVKARPARVGHNPATREPVNIPAKPAHDDVKVKALKGLKDMV